MLNGLVGIYPENPGYRSRFIQLLIRLSETDIAIGQCHVLVKLLSGENRIRVQAATVALSKGGSTRASQLIQEIRDSNKMEMVKSEGME